MVLRTEQGLWGEHLQQAMGRGTMGNSQVPRCMAVCGNKDREGLAECRLVRVSDEVRHPRRLWKASQPSGRSAPAEAGC